MLHVQRDQKAGASAELEPPRTIVRPSQDRISEIEAQQTERRVPDQARPDRHARSKCAKCVGPAKWFAVLRLRARSFGRIFNEFGGFLRLEECTFRDFDPTE